MWKYGLWHSADGTGAGCGPWGLDRAVGWLEPLSGTLARSGLLMLLLLPLLPPLSLLEDWNGGKRHGITVRLFGA